MSCWLCALRKWTSLLTLAFEQAKILTHVRCHMDDARIAVETGGSEELCAVWTWESNKASRRLGYRYWHLPTIDATFTRKEYGLHKGTLAIEQPQSMRRTVDAYPYAGYGH